MQALNETGQKILAAKEVGKFLLLVPTCLIVLILVFPFLGPAMISVFVGKFLGDAPGVIAFLVAQVVQIFIYLYCLYKENLQDIRRG